METKEKKKHGGARERAGRPFGTKMGHTIEASKAREYVIKRVAEELEPIIDAKLSLAKGIWREDVNDAGETIKIYREKPDAASIKYLMDQTIGKATETVQVKQDIVLKIDI